MGSTTTNIVTGDILKAHVAVGIAAAVKIGECVGVTGRRNRILDSIGKWLIRLKRLRLYQG
jgi:hypothetical protein